MKNTVKRIISFVLAAVMLFSAAIFADAAGRQYGDVNYDGEISSEDARLALRGSVGLETLVGDDFKAADVDGDGELTSADARYILRWSVGLDGGDVTEAEKQFGEMLYAVSHPKLNTYPEMFAHWPLNQFQKWCCYYTIHESFRPALEKCGYSQKRIDELAPTNYSKEALSKALVNGIHAPEWAAWLANPSVRFYVPSLLMDYYYSHPDIARVYNFYDYYDDVVNARMYYADKDDIKAYYPHVGDVLFMSNKTMTYSYGHPTIDHTAQIMKITGTDKNGYPTFLCTEGSIIENYEGDNIGKVRERTYHFNPEIGTWEFDYNPVVIVLTAARFDFSKK